MKVTSSLIQAEQIRNGDFSQGSTHWQVYENVDFDNERCNVGAGGIAAQILNSVPGGRYRLSCRAALVTSGSPTARLRLRYGSTDTIMDITSTTPQTYTNDFDLPAGSDSEIYIEGQGASAWFDDISLNLAPVTAELILNGDFSEGSAHWEAGASFEEQTCRLGVDQVAQTVPIPTIGYYQLRARARAGNGSMGRLQIRGIPGGESQYKPISSSDWSEYVIDIGAIQSETHFKVELGRVMNDDVEFDDVSLRLVSGAIQ